LLQGPDDESGVPVHGPGYQADNQDAGPSGEQAQEIGYRFLFKAVRWGRWLKGFAAKSGDRRIQGRPRSLSAKQPAVWQ